MHYGFERWLFDVMHGIMLMGLKIKTPLADPALCDMYNDNVTIKRAINVLCEPEKTVSVVNSKQEGR